MVICLKVAYYTFLVWDSEVMFGQSFSIPTPTCIALELCPTGYVNNKVYSCLKLSLSLWSESRRKQVKWSRQLL